MRGLWIGIALAALGCAAEDTAEADAHDAHDELIGEACLHAQQGPFEDVTATSGVEGAPEALFEHTAARLTIPDGGGVVALPVGEAGEYALFVGSGVEVTVAEGPGEIEETLDEDACAEIARRYVVHMEIGTVFLRFEGAEEAVFLIEHAQGEHQH